MAWLKFFRVVNLPTVPGDLLAGAAAVLSYGVGRSYLAEIVAACIAGVFIYMFGLADNDILGASTDCGRPIPEGKISLRAARVARGLCLFAALVAGTLANLPPAWWVSAFALTLVIVVYNRTKWCLAMGLCRGLNVWCGAAAVMNTVRGTPSEARLAAFVVGAVWLVYIAAVTRYSEGEELDPARKRRVGFLIGALVYLQLVALLVFNVTSLLIAGAVMLVLLRLMKRYFVGVSAS